MPKTSLPKKPDYRAQLYKSVRISKKAYKALADQAKKEDRTIIATLERALGI